MDLSAMFVDELITFLSSKGISKGICDQLEENAIDGYMLKALVQDIDEFVTVIPKAGHRLQLKRVVKAVDVEAEKENSETPSIDLTTSMTLAPDYTLTTLPSKPIAKTTPTKPIPKTPLSEPFVTTTPLKEKPVGFVHKNCSYQSDKSPNISEALPQNLPFPEKLSIKVEAAISNGSVVTERTQLIADVGTFYYGLSHHPRQGDYKRIAILVCEKFPELRDSNPSNYWVSIQKQLSQYFRNLRRRTACSKALVCGSAKESSAKKVKLSASMQDDEQTQQKNLELLRDAKEGSMSTKTYVGLVEDTFSYRRTFIQTLATSATEVLEMCSYLGDPKFPSTKPETMFKDKMVQFRLVALGSPSQIEQLFTAGEDQVFVECESDDLISAFIDLISTYYVFHVSYPDSMAGFLLFLQDISLKAMDNVFRGTKYSASCPNCVCD